MILLVDGDIITYRTGFASEHVSLAFCKARVRSVINSMVVAVQSTYNTEIFGTRIYLSDSNKPTFRHSIYPEYKANRIGMPKPRWYNEIRDYLVNEYSARISPNMEADDQISIDHTLLGNRSNIIASIDKDLLQLPGYHYNFVKKEFKYITKKEGIRNFYIQMLTGDRADNVKGIQGIGIIKANRLLPQSYTAESQLFNIVRYKYKNDDLMLMNGELLWLLRKPKETWKKRFKRLSRNLG